jgi:tetratricopeptide (TPR) repeat protein
VNEAPNLEMTFPPVTDGDIAVINLESSRQQSWSRFWRAPDRPGTAEYIVEQEQLAVQFLGDLDGLDRLQTLVNQLAGVDSESVRTALINAQVASMAHRFAEAREYLAQAEVRGAPPETTNRLSLSLDQACGTSLETVLETRRRLAAETGRLEDLVPLAALLADLREFDEAERIYCRALRDYRDVSPFAVAWVCFQLGVLWGELVAEPQSGKAAQWYEKAIEFLPCYVKARVHLAEMYTGCGRTHDAEALLTATVSGSDPEVPWRLADMMNASGRTAEAAGQMSAAHAGYRVLLKKHLLAFADHGAEFYSGSGNDVRRALELAKLNLANRPTLRAFEQTYAIAVNASDQRVATETLATAAKRWTGTVAFAQSPLTMCQTTVSSAEKPIDYRP